MFSLIYLIQTFSSSPIKYHLHKCREAQVCAQAITVIWREGFTWPGKLMHAWQIFTERGSYREKSGETIYWCINLKQKQESELSLSLVSYFSWTPCWEFSHCSNLERLWFNGTTTPSQRDRGVHKLTLQVSVMVFELQPATNISLQPNTIVQ